MVVVIRFAPDSAVELEHGVDADFPDSLRDGSPLGADSDFARRFVAPPLALDGDGSPFRLDSVPGEVSQLPKGDCGSRKFWNIISDDVWRCRDFPISGFAWGFDCSLPGEICSADVSEPLMTRSGA